MSSPPLGMAGRPQFPALTWVMAGHLRGGEFRIDHEGTSDMTRNVGGIDRIMRIVVGLVLLGLTFLGTIGWWGLIGLVPLATALLGFCPLYPLLGMNTCPMEQRKG